MDITGDMPDSIWIEGQSNLLGRWLSIHYPNFLYCSSCSMIGHSWEYCKKRKGVSSSKPIHEKDSDPKPKAVQKVSKQSTWTQAKIKQFYRTTGRLRRGN
ncbi:hypothetical protein FRX31_026670 [Thalictrum thalictroides]|uniref:Uncharacterized protein n=1 Tax=Thalictrum thalictroides TaxID=46969 RepID=A0A7J6VFS7_THATH|nr:hypothetical protein FRX31_026670 [Thalictrum thalictroides]